ncbi:phosphatase PAP2 family protein [Nocardioides sp. CN2-186]|uniref:phosphatase PAP2 family protein n=1 Tax=Nocardioides tweenelious TaxID=3156607 RepID=UPI0032B408E4
MEGYPSRSRRLVRAVVYGVLVVIPLAALAYLVRTQFGPLIRLDQHVSVTATDFARSHPGFRSFAETWELISQPWVVYAVLGLPVCAFAYFHLHLRTRALWALATMATGWAVAVVLKELVQRSRPAIEDPFSTHSGYSFPSGHATNNAIVITLVLLLLRPALGTTSRTVLLVVGALWVLVTCADRLVMGAHYLSDVIAGVVLGCGLCLASYAGYLGWSPPTTDTPSKKESLDGVSHPVG